MIFIPISLIIIIIIAFGFKTTITIIHFFSQIAKAFAAMIVLLLIIGIASEPVSTANIVKAIFKIIADIFSAF